MHIQISHLLTPFKRKGRRGDAELETLRHLCVTLRHRSLTLRHLCLTLRLCGLNVLFYFATTVISTGLVLFSTVGL